MIAYGGFQVYNVPTSCVPIITYPRLPNLPACLLHICRFDTLIDMFIGLL